MTDSTNLTNDRFGYSCYALVFPAPPGIATKVAAIEEASGMTRPKIPAHITVKGTFHQIEDLNHVRTVARQIVSGTRRFRILFEGAEVEHGPAWAGLKVRVTPEMQDLHDALVSAFKPLATTVYRDDPYGPHMTFFQEANKDGVAPAIAAIEKTDWGPGFEVTAVDLMGRRGPAYGGHWEPIERFQLARVPVRYVDPYILSNDRHGYAVYSTVLFANPEQRAKVQAIRDAVKVRRSMMPAHITSKGGFCEIPRIEQVRELLDQVCRETRPFIVEFEGQPRARKAANGEVLSTQAIRLTPDLVSLHERLIDTLGPVTTDAYQQNRPYHPHLTIYHEPEPALEQRGVELLGTLDIGIGYEVRELHFMGHVGRPYRGRWETLSVHRFNAG
ncbi:MAG: 2'-5' RNA ligase family protein [Chloroflexi bacterium]|nr:2'-5' RNA ligase family protein [Chloroflexota bacterium]